MARAVGNVETTWAFADGIEVSGAMLRSDVGAPFLTTSWRNLVMVNYEVDPAVLESWLPRGTELDFFEGTCLVSLVGFLFEDTKLWGRYTLPCHASFEEVNLRFYVVRRVDGELRRGVAFIKELAPSRAVTWVARHWFEENYHCVPMRRRTEWRDVGHAAQGGTFDYEWRLGRRWSTLWAQTAGELALPRAGSIEEFIVEHYWGYSAQHDGSTLEYRVEHRPWQVWSTSACGFDTDVATLYGREFVAPLTACPHSSLVADGSEVAVYRGSRIEEGRVLPSPNGRHQMQKATYDREGTAPIDQRVSRAKLRA